MHDPSLSLSDATAENSLATLTYTWLNEAFIATSRPEIGESAPLDYRCPPPLRARARRAHQVV